MADSREILLVEEIGPRILLIRGQKVMLDSDLAELYGVPTKVLNQAVKRNFGRFPKDFMFQLTWEESNKLLRSQFVTLKRGQHLKYRPYAFTEHGAIMVASVLNTPRAIQVSVYVVRAFVKLRELLATNKELAHKLAELERKVSGHDGAIRSLMVAIRQLMEPPQQQKKGQIGFHVNPND